MILHQLSSWELEEIETKLPPQFAALKNRYPTAVAAAAEYWDVTPYPGGYIPETIEFFYSEDRSIPFPHAIVKDGVLTHIEPMVITAVDNMVGFSIDDHPAYVRVEGRVILNRIDNVLLPEVITNPDLWAKAIARLIPNE